MNDIVVIGSTNIDMVVKTERFPEAGETILGGKFNKFFGGKGANQAVAAARLEGDVNFICKTGDDDFGKSTIQQFQKEGLNTEHILTDDEQATGVALIIVDKEGNNKIVVAPGANSEFSAEDAADLEEVIAGTELILLQLEIPVDTIGEIIRLAKKHDTNVILNPAPAQSLPKDYLENLFLVTPNEMEAQQMTGVEVSSKEKAFRAASILHDKGVENIVITLGARGAFVSTKEYTGMVSSPEVEVKDTTAAGDVFNGALAVALTNGKPWKKAVKYACHAAALSVAKDGAQDSAPYKDQLKEFADELA